MRQYNYAPINSEANEIRLLKILPGDFRAEIQIELLTTTLTKESVPQYEALSYAWGSTDDPSRITVLDSCGDEAGGLTAPLHGIRAVDGASDPSSTSYIEVTRNLAEALPYLRFKTETRMMWIDGICVNQQDLVERSKQVQRMADVFSLANRVVVWLGPGGADGHGTMATLAEIAAHVDVDLYAWSVKPSTLAGVDLRWSNMSEDIPMNHGQVSRLCEFLQRNWFQRLWIWQEIRLAKSGASMMCGTDILTWKQFSTAMACLEIGLHVFHRNVVAQNTLAPIICSVTSLCSAASLMSMRNLVVDTQSRYCTDPKDRVFAVMSLMLEDVSIVPDYSKTISEIYQQFLTKYIVQAKDLDLLQFSIMTESRLPLGLPTWVPDFSQSTPKKVLTETTISETVTNDVTFPDAQTLSLLGVRLSMVESVQQIAATTVLEDDLLPNLRALAPASIAEAENRYISGGNCFDAFYRLICGSLYPLIPPDHTIKTMMNASADMFQALYHPEKPSRVPELVSTEIIKLLSGHSFLKSVEGHVALGPESSEPGDEIVCILGCTQPFLLRRQHDEQFHQLVGPCRIEGLMGNEGLLGSLPENATLVRRYDEASKDWWPAWRDDVTGEVSINDPRWGPLPAGWGAKHWHLEHVWTWFENLETGEGTRSYANPHMRWETIRDRGVKLERFNLR